MMTAVRMPDNLAFVFKGNDETLKRLQQKPSKEILEESKRNAEFTRKIFVIKRGNEL